MESCELGAIIGRGASSRVYVAQHRPSMVLLLDEIDAALDDVNAGKVAALLHRLSAKTQVLAISHRPEFQRLADHTLKLAKRGEHTVVVAS